MSEPRHGYLVIISRSGADGKAFPMHNTRVLIGRKETCDIRMQRPQVSKEHCVIRATGNNELVLTNLSENFTLVNGHVLEVNQQQTLKSGDVITIVGRSLRYEQPRNNKPGEPPAATAATSLTPSSTINAQPLKQRDQLSKEDERKLRTPQTDNTHRHPGRREFSAGPSFAGRKLDRSMHSNSRPPRTVETQRKLQLWDEYYSQPQRSEERQSIGSNGSVSDILAESPPSGLFGSSAENSMLNSEGGTPRVPESIDGGVVGTPSSGGSSSNGLRKIHSLESNDKSAIDGEDDPFSNPNSGSSSSLFQRMTASLHESTQAPRHNIATPRSAGPFARGSGTPRSAATAGGSDQLKDEVARIMDEINRMARGSHVNTPISSRKRTPIGSALSSRKPVTNQTHGAPTSSSRMVRRRSRSLPRTLEAFPPLADESKVDIYPPLRPQAPPLARAQQSTLSMEQEAAVGGYGSEDETSRATIGVSPTSAYNSSPTLQKQRRELVNNTPTRRVQQTPAQFFSSLPRLPKSASAGSRSAGMASASARRMHANSRSAAGPVRSFAGPSLTSPLKRTLSNGGPSAGSTPSVRRSATPLPPPPSFPINVTKKDDAQADADGESSDEVPTEPEPESDSDAEQAPSSSAANGSNEQGSTSKPMCPHASSGTNGSHTTEETPRVKRRLVETSSTARKSVRFGPPLSPEVFDSRAPPSTPLRRGTPMQIARMSSILRQCSESSAMQSTPHPGVVKQPFFRGSRAMANGSTGGRARSGSVELVAPVVPDSSALQGLLQPKQTRRRMVHQFLSSLSALEESSPTPVDRHTAVAHMAANSKDPEEASAVGEKENLGGDKECAAEKDASPYAASKLPETESGDSATEPTKGVSIDANVEREPESKTEDPPVDDSMMDEVFDMDKAADDSHPLQNTEDDDAAQVSAMPSPCPSAQPTPGDLSRPPSVSPFTQALATAVANTAAQIPVRGTITPARLSQEEDIKPAVEDSSPVNIDSPISLYSSLSANRRGRRRSVRLARQHRRNTMATATATAAAADISDSSPISIPQSPLFVVRTARVDSPSATARPPSKSFYHSPTAPSNCAGASKIGQLQESPTKKASVRDSSRKLRSERRRTAPTTLGTSSATKNGGATENTMRDINASIAAMAAALGEDVPVMFGQQEPQPAAGAVPGPTSEETVQVQVPVEQNSGEVEALPLPFDLPVQLDEHPLGLADAMHMMAEKSPSSLRALELPAGGNTDLDMLSDAWDYMPASSAGAPAASALANSARDPVADADSDAGAATDVVVDSSGEQAGSEPEAAAPTTRALPLSDSLRGSGSRRGHRRITIAGEEVASATPPVPTLPGSLGRPRRRHPRMRMSSSELLLREQSELQARISGSSTDGPATTAADAAPKEEQQQPPAKDDNAQQNEAPAAEEEPAPLVDGKPKTSIAERLALLPVAPNLRSSSKRKRRETIGLEPLSDAQAVDNPDSLDELHADNTSDLLARRQRLRRLQERKRRRQTVADMKKRRSSWRGWMPASPLVASRSSSPPQSPPRSPVLDAKDGEDHVGGNMSYTALVDDDTRHVPVSMGGNEEASTEGDGRLAPSSPHPTTSTAITDTSTDKSSTGPMYPPPQPTAAANVKHAALFTTNHDPAKKKRRRVTDYVAQAMGFSTTTPAAQKDSLELANTDDRRQTISAVPLGSASANNGSEKGEEKPAFGYPPRPTPLDSDWEKIDADSVPPSDELSETNIGNSTTLSPKANASTSALADKEAEEVELAAPAHVDEADDSNSNAAEQVELHALSQQQQPAADDGDKEAESQGLSLDQVAAAPPVCEISGDKEQVDASDVADAAVEEPAKSEAPRRVGRRATRAAQPTATAAAVATRTTRQTRAKKATPVAAAGEEKEPAAAAPPPKLRTRAAGSSARAAKPATPEPATKDTEEAKTKRPQKEEEAPKSGPISRELSALALPDIVDDTVVVGGHSLRKHSAAASSAESSAAPSRTRSRAKLADSQQEEEKAGTTSQAPKRATRLSKKAAKEEPSVQEEERKTGEEKKAPASKTRTMAATSTTRTKRSAASSASATKLPAVVDVLSPVQTRSGRKRKVEEAPAESVAERVAEPAVEPAAEVATTKGRGRAPRKTPAAAAAAQPRSTTKRAAAAPTARRGTRTAATKATAAADSPLPLSPPATRSSKRAKRT